MTRKLPDDAFTFYVGLGPGRSYAAVADRFGVNKKTVTRTALAQRWRERLAEVEAKAREGTHRRLVESLEEVNERHLRMLRAVQQRALEALRSMPLKTAIDAVRSLHDAIKNERLVLGEPNDRTAINVEDLIKREHARWMSENEEDDDPATTAENAEEVHDDRDDS
ncbi:MAG: hypothetical protein H6674_09315 [Dehalococcoidia bacterium]|nr:hypothetical protein [Dehalococcoidia bacterium]